MCQKSTMMTFIHLPKKKSLRPAFRVENNTCCRGHRGHRGHDFVDACGAVRTTAPRPTSLSLFGLYCLPSLGLIWKVFSPFVIFSTLLPSSSSRASVNCKALPSHLSLGPGKIILCIAHVICYKSTPCFRVHRDI